MKVLWLCNIIIPRISSNLGLKQNPVGGWLVGASDSLLNNENISLVVLFPSAKKYNGEINQLHYYSFDGHNNQFESILAEEQPDVIHIFGTEFKHSYDMVCAAEKLGYIDRVVIHIQGLISICGRYHFRAELPPKILLSWTFFDLFFGNIEKQRKKFLLRGHYEELALSKTNNIAGRTEWDKACCLGINPSLKYYHCGEILRESFYNHKRDRNEVDKHSIFICQSNYPIKGFHLALETIRILKRTYPDVKLFTTGNDPNAIPWYRKNGYAKYVGTLIKKYDLENSVIFLGKLDEKQMVKQLLKTEVYYLASSIENSPNSLGEAMMLGLPCVSSNVGGIESFFSNGIDGFLFPYDEPYMAASYISYCFDNPSKADELGNNARTHASIFFDKNKIEKELLEMYYDIGRHHN